ncbi:hypothetical protein [Dehalobacter sp. TeCB1]|uniref:hypothetical protein n=1 Tax=Dehalobacter sp. TeCB1 TaxID=1843715 RepID=UPI00083AD507|nr:hypothetical protein [Dehalobacter sp. TeCB1]OCZ50399.1 hypothetical protein A7D23_15300 [Dehalobacter sp. TeCB1]
MKQRLIIKILSILVIVSVSVAGCSGFKRNSITFYKTYDVSTASVLGKLETVPASTQVYVEIISNKPFNAETVGFVITTERSGTKLVISGANIKVDPTDKKVVIPLSMSEQGKYTIDVYVDKPENVMISEKIIVEQ